MKRILILSLCIVLSSALVANAAMLVSSTRTSYDANLDKIDFHITGLTGAQAGDFINAISGTWTGIGGTINLSTSALGWKGATGLNSSFKAPAAPLSFVNFNSNAGDLARVGSGSAYSSFGGSWFTTEPAVWLQPVDPDLGDGFDQTLLASMYITKGANVGFAGEGSMAVAGQVFPVAFASPEPGTLALLITGALGLLVFAWKKRK